MPILVPTTSEEDWRRLLAKPELHWKAGYSAMTLARSWEAAAGLPPEVAAMFEASPRFGRLEPLMIVPEYKVSLPGGQRDSQTDVFVVARLPTGLVTVAVEGKVDEPFGPTVAERLATPSAGVEERLSFIGNCLGLPTIPPTIRYQLLHRTASAVLAGRQFFAGNAVMLVHSFSPSNRWFDDFAAFARLFGIEAQEGVLASARLSGDVQLSLGWCRGDQRFRLDR